MASVPSPQLNPRARSVDRSVLVIAGLIIGLVIVAVVAALTLGNRPPASYPAGSPEAAFQQYVQAVEGRQFPVAYDLLSRSVRSQLTLTEFEREQSIGGLPSDSTSRLRIDRSQVSGDRATLWVTIERFYGTGLDARRVQFSNEVHLVHEDSVWKIDERFAWRF